MVEEYHWSACFRYKMVIDNKTIVKTDGFGRIRGKINNSSRWDKLRGIEVTSLELNSDQKRYTLVLK